MSNFYLFTLFLSKEYDNSAKMDQSGSVSEVTSSSRIDRRPILLIIVAEHGFPY